MLSTSLVVFKQCLRKTPEGPPWWGREGQAHSHSTQGPHAFSCHSHPLCVYLTLTLHWIFHWAKGCKANVNLTIIYLVLHFPHLHCAYDETEITRSKRYLASILKLVTSKTSSRALFFWLLGPLSFFFFFLIFICLHQILVVAHGFSSHDVRTSTVVAPGLQRVRASVGWHTGSLVVACGLRSTAGSLVRMWA